MVNAYDRVRYPSVPYTHTHPSALGVYLQLFGKPFVPLGASRVLELGCGEGANLMGMAVGAPSAQFVGVDLAEQPIAAGRAIARACGLNNVSLHVGDIARMEASLGRFDYIIAHGVYAWVPDDIRAALMRVVGERLSDHGLAMISYNTFPGSRIRQALRDMLLYVTDGVDDPREILELARAFLAEQIEAWSDDDPDERALKVQARRKLAKSPESLFHDELGAEYAPQLLSDVAAAANAVGLEYLCDAGPLVTQEAFFPSAKFDAARARAAGDWVRFEQLADFHAMRDFRNSIFCRGGGIDRRREAARLRGLWACGELRALDADPKAPDSAAFAVRSGAKLSTNDPKLTRFLTALAETYPLSLSLDEAAKSPALAEYVFRLFLSQVIRLQTAQFPLTATPGERPIASPLARFQVANGQPSATTLHHTMVSLEDPSVRAFIALLDGTRTRADLSREIAASHNVPRTVAEIRVTEALAALARAGLIMDQEARKNSQMN